MKEEKVMVPGHKVLGPYIRAAGSYCWMINGIMLFWEKI